MEKFIGVKIITVIRPMNSTEALNSGYRTNGVGTMYEPEPGYEVLYEDGYKSWSPKNVFEKAYRRTDGMTFGLAIEALKLSGNDKTIPTVKVARKGWNGKGMWISFVDPYNNKQFTLEEKEIEGTFLPYIGMKTADGKYVPWLASQTDILAEDWTIVE